MSLFTGKFFQTFANFMLKDIAEIKIIDRFRFIATDVGIIFIKLIYRIGYKYVVGAFLR